MQRPQHVIRNFEYETAVDMLCKIWRVVQDYIVQKPLFTVQPTDSANRVVVRMHLAVYSRHRDVVHIL